MSQKNVTRRGFIKGAAVAGASFAAMGATSGFAMPVSKPAKWDNEADVIIIGAGSAGLSAAVEAVNQKLSVIVIEKEPIIGGSSTICGGALSFAGTERQKEMGIKDSTDLFTKDLLEVGMNANNPELIKAFMGVQLEMYNWLRDNGVKMVDPITNSGMSVPRQVTVQPAEVIKTLNDYATSRGAKVVLNTAAEQLVFDGKKICGVTAKSRNRAITFGAKKAVILTAGGYSRNPEMLGQFTPAMRNAKAIAGLGTTGDGLKMAMAYGANLLDTPYVKATYGFTMTPSTINDTAYLFHCGGIIVNKQGQRIVNESLSYKLLGDAVLVQEGACGYQIYDEPMRQEALKKGIGVGSPEKPEKDGKVFKANTIAEVAKMAGLDGAVVEATVKRYNGFVDAKNDPEFGRKSVVGNYGTPIKIEKGPFYCYPSTACMIATYCGVQVNTKTEVVDVFGTVIPGLLAAGEMTGGFHGAAYMTGTSFCKSLVFGRISARTAAKM